MLPTYRRGAKKAVWALMVAREEYIFNALEPGERLALARVCSSAQMKGRGRPDGCAHAAFDPLDENPRRIDTVAAHFRTSSAIGESQSASKVCEGPIAVITRAIDPE